MTSIDIPARRKYVRSVLDRGIHIDKYMAQEIGKMFNSSYIAVKAAGQRSSSNHLPRVYPGLFCLIVPI